MQEPLLPTAATTKTHFPSKTFAKSIAVTFLVLGCVLLTTKSFFEEVAFETKRDGVVARAATAGTNLDAISDAGYHWYGEPSAAPVVLAADITTKIPTMSPVALIEDITTFAPPKGHGKAAPMTLIEANPSVSPKAVPTIAPIPSGPKWMKAMTLVENMPMPKDAHLKMSKKAAPMTLLENMPRGPGPKKVTAMTLLANVKKGKKAAPMTLIQNMPSGPPQAPPMTGASRDEIRDQIIAQLGKMPKSDTDEIMKEIQSVTEIPNLKTASRDEIINEISKLLQNNEIRNKISNILSKKFPQYKEISNEMRNMGAKVGWKKDFIARQPLTLVEPPNAAPMTLAQTGEP